MPAPPVILNNTPLVALWTLNQFTLLRELYTVVWIAQAIEAEFLATGRAARQDLGTTAAQAIGALRKKAQKTLMLTPEADTQYRESADAFARNELSQGVITLAGALHGLPADQYAPPSSTILQEMATRLDELGSTRREYLLLTLHTLEIGWQASPRH